MTHPLNFEQGGPVWEAFRKKAKTDLFFLASTILGYADLFPLRRETHLLFCKFLERKTGIPDIDLAPIQKCETPRGTGKTSIGTVSSSIQEVLKNPETAIMIANEKAETAENFLGVIKTHFETNDMLRSLFPELVFEDWQQTTWKSDGATIRRSQSRPEPTFFTTGVGGTRTGMHPDIIIVDDPISKEAMEAARVGAWMIMERVNRWCNELKLLLNTQAKPFPWIRVNGTRWWMHDTYEYIETQYGRGEEERKYRISAKLPDGRTVSREVYRVGDVAVFRAAAIEDSVAVYPDIYSLETLAKLREDDPELYACNLLNKPTDASVRTFQDPWLRYYERLDPKLFQYKLADGKMRFVKDEDLRKVLVCDPAFTASGTGARAAIVVTGTDTETGMQLVLEASAQRAEPADLVTDILNVAQRHKLHTIYVEAVAQQIAFIQFIENQARRKNLPIYVEQVKPGGRNKDIRIESLSPFFRAGNILVHRSQLDLLSEYASFRPGARYKDLLDALAYCAERWATWSPGPGSARDRANQQLETYRARRGLSAAS